MGVYEELLGKYVTDEIGGDRGWERLERHWRKVSWIGSESAIETWRRRNGTIAKIVVGVFMATWELGFGRLITMCALGQPSSKFLARKFLLASLNY